MALPSWSLSTSWQQHISFPITFQSNMWSFTTLAHVCPPPFEQFIGQQMVQLWDSISKCMHHRTLSNMPSNETSKAHHVWFWPCYGLRASTWLIAWPIFPTFQLFSLVFCIALHMWLGLPDPLICVHTSHWLYGYSPLMLCSWQQMHWNLWCNSQHLCRHYTRC
jgi:hypothetical protein